MNEKLVLLEYKEDAAYFQRKIMPSIKDVSFTVIVLDDDPVFFLRENSISFLHIGDFHLHEAEGRLCEKSWQWVESFCKDVDTYLCNNIPFLTGGAPFLSSQIDVLKFVFDSIIIRIEVLKNIFNRQRPKEVFFAKSKIIQPGHSRLFFDESFSLFSVLLEEAWDTFAHPGTKKNCWESRYKLYSSFFDKESRMMNAVRLLKYIIQSLSVRCTDNNITEDSLRVCLVGGRELSLQSVVNDLREHNADMYSWEPISAFNPAPVGTLADRIKRLIAGIRKVTNYKNELKKAFSSLEKEKWFLNYFIWRGVSFYSIVRQRIYYAIVRQVAHQQVIIEEAAGLMPYIDALLSSYFLTFRRPIAFVANQHNIKVISVQHGAMSHDAGGYDWKMEKNPHRASNKNYFYTDMASVDVKLVWGRAEADDMKNWNFNEKTPEILIYGAGHLKHLSNIKSSNALIKKILFISNAIGNNVFLLMNFHGYRYRMNQLAILESLININSPHQVLYKEYKSWNRNEIYRSVKQKFMTSNLSFIPHTIKLLDILAEADIVVLDFPSTSLFETCLTKLPVFVFNNAYTIKQEVKSMLCKRVYYSESLHEFCSMMKKLIIDPQVFPYLDNNEFTNNFVDIDTNISVLDILKKKKDKCVA